jgi:AcrR family transcriptional regulator
MSRPLSQEARLKALAAAEDVLRELGVEGFSIDEVARRSRVAKSTIYRHFSSSNELLIQVLDRMIEMYPTPDTGSLRDDLVSFVNARMEMINEQAWQRIFRGVHNRATSDPEFARIHARFMRDKQAPIHAIVEYAKVRGDIHPGLDTELASDLIVGPLFVRSHFSAQPLTSDTVYGLIDLIVAALLNWEPHNSS